MDSFDKLDSNAIEQAKLCNTFYVIVERLVTDYNAPTGNEPWSPKECVVKMFEWGDIRFKGPMETALRENLHGLQRIVSPLIRWMAKVRIYLFNFDDTRCDNIRSLEIMSIIDLNGTHVRNYLIPFLLYKFDTIFEEKPKKARLSMLTTLHFMVDILDCPKYNPRP